VNMCLFSFATSSDETIPCHAFVRLSVDTFFSP
jgi:hypothetical protein